MENIGDQIKKLRLAKRWGQAFVAELLNISIPAYSKIENDITNLSVTRVRQLAEVFHVPVEALMEGDAVFEHELIKKGLEIRLEEQHAVILALNTKIIALYEELHQVEMEAN